MRLIFRCWMHFFPWC